MDMKAKEQIAISVVKAPWEENHELQGERLLKVIISKVKTEWTEDEKGEKEMMREERIGTRTAKMMGGQGEWTQITTRKMINKNGSVLVSATSGKTRGVGLINVKKEFRQKAKMHDTWKMLTEEQKKRILAADYGYMAIEEILIDIDEWDAAEETIDRLGFNEIYTRGKPWK